VNIKALLKTVSLTPINELPGFHTCKVSDFEKITISNALARNLNKWLKRELVFFYYGRSMYSLNNSALKSVDDFHFLPIAICISNKKLNTLKYTSYPVDSGGFIKDGFSMKLPSSWKIEDLEIGQSQSDINKYIYSFYLGTENYIKDMARDISDIDDPDTIELINFLNNKSSTQIDGRSRTIELAIEDDVTIDDGVIFFVHNKMENQIFFKEYLKKLRDINIKYEVRKYYTVDQISPNAAYSCLNGEVRKYMEELI
jgi:hypothetical protein